MTRITLNEIDATTTLSAAEQKATRGGYGYWTAFGYMPLFGSIYSPYASGYGGFNNVFSAGTFGHSVQAATFSSMASWDNYNQNWLANF